MTYKIEETNEFVIFFQSQCPNIKMKKEILMQIYNILKKSVKNFPIINERTPHKAALIEHLNANLNQYKKDYLKAIKIIIDH